MSVERIALVSFHTCPNALLGEGKAGGMNVYVRELSQKLGAMGLEVDIFTRCHGGQEADTIALGDNVRVIHLPGGPVDADLGTFVAYLPDFIQAMDLYRRQHGLHYQVVHSHYWLAGWVGREVARGWDLPHVVTFHTLAEAKKQARSGEQEPHIRSAIEAELMASAQLVISFSDQERETMVRLYGAPAERIQIVPCGVDLSVFRPLDILEARQRLGLNGEKIILYVGRIEPLKGLELLCQATAIMEVDEPFKVLIIGGGPEAEGDIKRLKSMSQGLGIGDAVEFVGRMDQMALPVYYSAADVCVVPSYYESFSLVALEAMACGTPVVACRVGGLPTVIDHGRTGYLHSWRCPEPFADSLQVLLASGGLKRSMGMAARKRAESMGWDAVAEATYHLYESVVPMNKTQSSRT